MRSLNVMSSLPSPPPGLWSLSPVSHHPDTILHVIYYETLLLLLRGPILEHQSIKNLQDHLVASLERRQKICLGSTSRQPSACQIPFDAELMAGPGQAGADCRLSLSRRARNRDGGLLGLDEPWVEASQTAHYLLLRNRQFKCQFCELKQVGSGLKNTARLRHGARPLLTGWLARFLRGARSHLLFH